MQSTQPKKSTFKNPFTAPVKVNNDPGPQGDVKPKKKKTKNPKADISGCDGDASVKPSTVKKKSESEVLSKSEIDNVCNVDKRKETKKKKKAIKKNAQKSDEVNTTTLDDEVPGSTCAGEMNESTCLTAVESVEKKTDPAVEYDQKLEGVHVSAENPITEQIQTESEVVRESESKVPKKSTLPVRSLTNIEYEEIFQSAINRAMNTALDDLFRELQKKPKPVKSSKIKAEPTLVINALPEKKKPKKHSIPEKDGNSHMLKSKKAHISKMNQSGNVTKSQGTDGIVPHKELNLSEIMVNEEVNLTTSQNEDDLEIERADHKEKETNKEKLLEEEEVTQLVIQQMNEITPEGSEHDNVPPDTKMKEMSPPPKKKKKLVCPQKKKEQKLEPKKLPFSMKVKAKKDEKESVKKLSRVKKDVHSCRSKLAPKSESVASPVVKKRQSKKNVMLEREIISYGTWVQCCDKTCSKWRYLADIDDPSILPEVWYCHMSNDIDHNSCEIPEDEYDESEHIFTTFSEGSIVWAKLAGFPWWPAMIEMDPDSEYFFIIDSPESMHPSHYHVVFFDDKVSRAWVRTSNIEPFIGRENLGSILNTKLQKRERGPSFKKEVEAAKQKALQALELTAKERIQQYSFSVRYKGKWGSTATESQIQGKKKKLMKKPAKKKYCNVGKAPRVEVLNDTTVDDLLNNPDCSVLRKLQDALDSMDSDLLTEDSEKWEIDGIDDDWEMSESRDLEVQHSPVVSKPVSICRGERVKNRNAKRKCLSFEVSSSDSSSSGDEDIKETNKRCAKRSKKAEKKNNETAPNKNQLQSKQDSESSSEEETEKGELKFDPQVFTMEMDSEGKSSLDKNMLEDLDKVQRSSIEAVIENMKVEDVVEVENEILGQMLNQAEEIVCDALISNVSDEILNAGKKGNISKGKRNDNDMINNSANAFLLNKEKESEIMDSSETKENIKKKKESKKKSKKAKLENGNASNQIVSNDEHIVPGPDSQSPNKPEEANNDTSTKKNIKKSGKKTFKAPESKEPSEKPVTSNSQEKKASQVNSNLPKSPKIADSAEILGMRNPEIQGASLVPAVEQMVPDEGRDEENLPHLNEDVSLDLDVDPLHKHETQEDVDIPHEVITVGFQDDDEDSDPFEMTEE